MSKMHVKRGDTVMVIAGKDKGSEGKIIAVMPSKHRVVVEGVNIRTMHVKARSAKESGGIQKEAGPIDSSNVMIICPACAKTTRVAHAIIGDKKLRICKKCGESLEPKEKKEKKAAKKGKKEDAEKADKAVAETTETTAPAAKKPAAKKPAAKKAEPKADAKAEAKTEAKAETATEENAKPAAKKPAAKKAAPKAETNTEVNTEVKAEETKSE